MVRITKFPFVIAIDSLRTQVFLINVITERRIPLINLKKVHKFYCIYDIQQTSKLQDPSQAKHNSNLKELMLHFNLKECDKDGGDRIFMYCKLKLSEEAINLLIETKGAIPSTFMESL